MVSTVKRASNTLRHVSRCNVSILLVAATNPSTDLSMNPVSPGVTTSGTEPHGRAITGVPHASASIIARPNGSGQSIVNSKAKALPRNSLFSDSLISPIYSTSGGTDEA